jgi:hypothetical protein
MKAPGRVWLQFEVDGDPSGSTLYQTAIFDPHGLAGLAYWYALYPIHHLIFQGMLRAIERAATSSAAPAATTTASRCGRTDGEPTADLGPHRAARLPIRGSSD